MPTAPPAGDVARRLRLDDTLLQMAEQILGLAERQPDRLEAIITLVQADDLVVGDLAAFVSMISSARRPRPSRRRPCIGLPRCTGARRTSADARPPNAWWRAKPTAGPLVAAIKAWLEAQAARVSGKSPLGEALRYALNHWNGLCLFLEDGRVEMDTNAVERSMRPQALTRKSHDSVS